ncbi:MAG TPA: glycosyltransferase [Bacteroidales bacterium]|nr:glycosyltransferase [Bacteroidales bacterium]HPT21483.1 glycosyltransferase [Bacteroidales bacterium]
MKIISLGTAYPYRGGLASFNERLAKQFSLEGHDIRIVTFSMQYPGFLFPGKTQYAKGPAPDGIKITRLINSINPFNWIRNGLKLKKKSPDFILIKYWIPLMAPCLGTLARIAKSNGHTKVICIFDNVIPHEKRVGDRLLTKYFVNCIDGAVVMSNTVLEDLKSFRKDIPVKFNPHPLFDNFGAAVPRNEALSKLNLDDDNSYLLFFGFVRAYKGLDLLIEAFSDKRLRSRKLKLVIAGEFYEDDSPFKELIKKNNLENEVVIYDRFINDDEVALFFSIADLVALPYRAATQSGVTQIAYHFEKPMLVTEVGGLKEIVADGKCGYVVKPEPESIAEAIVDFYDNKKNEAFTEGVKQEKEKFSWDKMTKSIMEVYKKSL